MLVSGKEILQKAHKEGYGVAAFNVNNMEFVKVIFEAANEVSSPLLIEASEGAIKYAGAEMIYNMVKTCSDLYPHIPIALHLDHGTSMQTCVKVIKAGFTSVMIDASHYDLETNIAKTKEVCEIAHSVGVGVEAELGRLMGIEDNIVVSEKDACFTNPDEAKIFVEKTGIDYLAPSIGTSHGAYKFKGEPKLDFDRLKKIKALCDIPLVLHGASSIPDEVRKAFEETGGDLKGSRGVPFSFLEEAVEGGVNKVNTDTDLRIAFIGQLRRICNEEASQIDPRKFFIPAMDAVKKVIIQRMNVLKSVGKI